MNARIRSQHGNVIAADFRPRTSIELTVSFDTETLYADGHVTLMRTIASVGGKPVAVTHILGDLATGKITHL